MEFLDRTARQLAATSAVVWVAGAGFLLSAGVLFCNLPLGAIRSTPIDPAVRQTVGLGVREAGEARETNAPDPESVPGASGAWWTEVQTDLERREYAASTTAQGSLQAPNRAHNLRTTFGEHGIAVVPRTDKDVVPAWKFAWEASGFGRAGRMESVGPAAPEANGARVTYRRDGWSEWYENSAKGLEQGFTIERQPAGDGPLLIAGDFSAALRPEVREDGAIDFTDLNGVQVLRYGELKVWDVRGTELEAEILVAGTTLSIAIDDHDATYPLLVDPVITSPAWTAESDQANANFGFSVGTAGDVNGDGFSDVIVGARNFDNGETNEGRAYLYHGSASGVSITPNWIAEGDQASAQFGYAVGTAGDVNGDGFSDVIVGAQGFNNNGQSGQGRAFAYHGSAGGLAATFAWAAGSSQAAAFGHSVATAGDVNGDGFADVIVGAPNFTNGQSAEGRTFVYLGSAEHLDLSPIWTVESNQASANFGISVAAAGDVNGDGYSDVIVGAWGYDNGQTDEGRAFVYHGAASGIGVVFVELWSDQADARFSFSVATAGDVNGDGYSDVIVGAPAYDNGEFDEGRAFVYHGSGAGLSFTPNWTAESDQVLAEFGASVATVGDVNGDGFSDVIVGAWLYDNGQTDEGRAFVYHGSAAGLSFTPNWTAESDQPGASFGNSVATAGDVNGDGFSDVIVGAWQYTNGEGNEGRAFAYHGSAAGLSTNTAWTTESNQVSAEFGTSVATAGDVNGDGFSDVIVGAYRYDNGQTNEGRAFVYHGSAAGLSTSPPWTAESNQIDAWFGYSVATAGDVNGDGFSDVIIGAKFYDNGETDEGCAFVYQGSVAGLAATPTFTAEPNTSATWFGHSVATAGDVNGDGFSDVVIGAPFYASGAVFPYHGSATGLIPALTLQINQPGAEFGRSVATAGDVNGDGFSDVIVGAPYYLENPSPDGRAFVFYGNEGASVARTPRQMRTDDSASISLLGMSDSPTSFLLKALGRTVAGRGQVRLQIEVKPFGVPFDGSGLVTGATFDTGAPAQGIGSAVPLTELVSGLTAETLYHWRLRIAADSPFFPRSPWLGMPGNAMTEADLRTADAQTGIESGSAPRASILLEAPQPNPFGTSAAIGYTLPRGGRVQLAVYDAAGRTRRVLMDAVVPAGRRVTTWDGRDARGTMLPAGIYFVRLAFDGHVEAQKVVLAP